MRTPAIGSAERAMMALMRAAAASVSVTALGRGRRGFGDGVSVRLMAIPCARSGSRPGERFRCNGATLCLQRVGRPSVETLAVPAS